MVAIASKHLLAVGPDKGLAATVARELDAGNMPVTWVADHSIDWDQEGILEALFEKHRPFLLLHEVDWSQFRSAPNSPDDSLVRRSHQLAAACERHECIAMHLSDYHVFGGDTKNAYDEDDPVAPLDGYGRLIAELEREFLSCTDRQLIVRFSWLIDTEGTNLLTRSLRALHEGQELRLSRYRRGAPTWQADACRVLCGVIRQVVAGADNWGVFHYCSADSCNEWEFGREVRDTLAEMAELAASVEPDDVKEASGYPLEPPSATLNTRRIRDNFGVHARSWRQGLKAGIAQWLEQQAGAKDLRSSAGS